MPARIKVILSIIVVIAAIGGYFFQAGLGNTWPSFAALFFGAIAVISMWIFPEVSHKKNADTKERP
jgi:membrane protein YdbS with pleckstrin-like domain